MSSVLSRPATQPVEQAEPGWLPLIIVLAGTFVTFLDFFIVNVGLPSIADELNANPSSLSLVVAGYGLTFAVGMITGGRLGDLYGRRRMFVLGLALFTITSLACGLAPTIGVLVAARVLQGAAAALLTPQVLSVAATIYTGRRRTTAFSAYGFAMGTAGVLGQLAGGALITADVAGLGWRAIFLINVPVGVVAVPIARRMLPESHGCRARIDLLGVVTLTAALVAVVLPLVEGQQHGWPAWTWASLALAPFLIIAFFMVQRRRARVGRAPLVEPSLFGSRGFTVGTVVAFTFALVPASFFFVLAIYLQEGRGYGPLFSGIVFVAVGAGYFVAVLVAERVQRRLGHQVLTLGAAVTSAGCGLLALSVHVHTSAALLPGLALIGYGVGLVLVPVSSTALADVDAQHAGAASGVLTTAQQVGAALGVAIIGVVFFSGDDVIESFRNCLAVGAGLSMTTAVAAQFLRRRPRRTE